MPGPLTLDADNESLSTLRDHWFFTLVRVQHEPLASALLPALTAFGPTIDATIMEETARGDAITLADAGAVAADRGINELADDVTVAIHGGKKPDLGDPLHALYFGSAAPAEIKRPILGTQLDRQSGWPALLGQATQPALLALAPKATTLVAAAQQADAAAKKAASDNAKFRLDGQRRQTFDAYNALSATTYGALKAIVHDHPELKLASDWAESFFRRGQRSRGPTTVKQAETLVTKAQAELDAATKDLAALVAKQEADAKAAAERTAAEAELAEARKGTAEAKKKEKAAAEALKKNKKK